MTAAPLRVGFAKVDLTPPLDAAYLSFHPRLTRFEGIHDRLHARAMAVEAGESRAAIVTFDGLGLSRTVLGRDRDVIELIRQRVHERCGIAPDHLLIAATHAHSTPQTTDLHDLVGWFPHLREWVERLLGQLVAAVELAWQSREPGRLTAGVGHAPGIAWNRRILTRDGRLAIPADRPPDDQVVKEPRDDRVPCLLFTGATRRGALGGFCCHPTTVQVQPLVSADYPGVACALAESALDLDACLFVQGACGDVGPVRRTTDFTDVARYGRSLGGELIRQLALLDAPDAAPLPPVVHAARARVAVPRRPLPDQAALAAEVTLQRQRIQAAGDESERQAAVAAFRRAFEPLRLCELGDGPVPVEVQALRLGDVLFVGVEGELFCEFGHQLIAASPAPLTVVAGYANGYQGYLPSAVAWDEGGYEVGVGPWTRVGRDGGERVTAAAAALARRVWEESEG